MREQSLPRVRSAWRWRIHVVSRRLWLAGHRQERRNKKRHMQNGSGLDFQKRLEELEADKAKTVEMIKGIEAQANQAIAAWNEQGQHLNRALQRIEGAIAFIKAEVLGQVQPVEPEPEKPIVEVAS